jgi:hypothetical protein
VSEIIVTYIDRVPNGYCLVVTQDGRICLFTESFYTNLDNDEELLPGNRLKVVKSTLTPLLGSEVHKILSA